MTEKEPIIFKCEDSLWRMLASGSKPFDMRRWDLTDERIGRLALGRLVESGSWMPTEYSVSFQNKATGELLTFEYVGVEFAEWAPDWGFILLGVMVAFPNR